ncbi:MAG TPA: coenzyme F430 synthase [Methanoregula sp.]|nr:coenzyme F430 synthase [Methanoregula sp.]
MHILVLDTIHGGYAIGEAFSARGDRVDCVDVYRGESVIDVPTARAGSYDLIVAPVHLDPGHPLLASAQAPVISHHEAVRLLLGENIPQPMIEITGARGKTTTAHALASLMQGAGILHTSTGTYRFPGKEWIAQSSITPASVLAAAKMALDINGWLIAEESLGVSGAGTLSIITSDGDYACAAGKKSAVAAKVASAKHARHLLLAENIEAVCSGQVSHLEDIAVCSDTMCSVTFSGSTVRFSNPLLAIPGYHTPLMLAAAAAMILGLDPGPLSSFEALPGRMSLSYENGRLIVDNANSGTNTETTIEAAQYARRVSGNDAITLVIGQAAGDGAVCEGFAADQMLEAIDRIHPDQVIWVGPSPLASGTRVPFVTECTSTLDEARVTAPRMGGRGSIVLAVKTWR